MNCYASHHLTLAESAVLAVCLRLTCGGNKPLHFDGRAIAARFTGVSHQTVYRVAKSLAAKGWLVKKSGGFRAHAKNGLYAHTVYNVLTHEQWVLKHKNECRTVITSENGETKPPSSPVDHRPSSSVDHSSVIRTSVFPSPAKSSFLSGAGTPVRSTDVSPAVITSENGEHEVYARVFKQRCEEGTL